MRRAQIASGLSAVRERVRLACVSAGRPDEVDLVVVTKTFPATDVDILADLGVSDIGENRDQEARAKRAALSGESLLRWHMLGQLQRNKVSSIARWADAVDSVDRADVVAALGRAAAGLGRRIDVLIQVSLDSAARTDRGGVAASGAVDLAAAVAAEPGLHLKGVMGVAPFPGDPAEAFARLSSVSASVRDRWPDAECMSAGMSGDLEAAIAAGATQVRIGGAILGRRGVVQ